MLKVSLFWVSCLKSDFWVMGIKNDYFRRGDMYPEYVLLFYQFYSNPEMCILAWGVFSIWCIPKSSCFLAESILCKHPGKWMIVSFTLWNFYKDIVHFKILCMYLFIIIPWLIDGLTIVVGYFTSLSEFPWFHQQDKPKAHLIFRYLLQDNCSI